MKEASNQYLYIRYSWHWDSKKEAKKDNKKPPRVITKRLYPALDR